MERIKDDFGAVRETVLAALAESGRAEALLAGGETDGAKLTAALDGLCGRFERGTVLLRNICEKHRENAPARASVFRETGAPAVSGSAEINAYGWIHITLNALLPNCRFGAPAYISDTVTRLLDGLERGGRALPRFERAMLVIDEHCDIESRNVFDQDNKAWKAVANAVKGRIVPDDDQFTLAVALLSTKSGTPACHIHILPADEAGDFFWCGRDGFFMPP